MKNRFCFTEEELAKIPPAEPGKRIHYRDTVNKYLALRVSATAKSFVAIKKNPATNQMVFVTLGPYPGLTLKAAKQAANEAAVSLGKGINPNEEEREQARQEEAARAEKARQEEESRKQAEVLKARQTTLQENFDTYLDKRNLKPGTRTIYEVLFKLHLSDWLTLPVCEITKDMITARHSAIAKGERGRPQFVTVPKTPEEIEAERKALEDRKPTRGQRANENVKISLTKRIPDPDPKKRGASADGTMRVLRAVINFARDDHEDLIPVNPVERLSRRKEWYRVPRRRRLIKNSDLPAWHKAVMALDHDIMRDYLLFLLFTGLRRTEAAALTWGRVDFAEQAFTILDTKNKDPHTLPLSDYLNDLLKRRKESAVKQFVFPGGGKSGYMTEPKRAIDDVTDTTGIEFSCHDLRRTFSTVAESLDLSRYTIKALLNHRQDSGDVTGGYIQLDVERLRGPMQRITDAILEKIGKQHGQVVSIDTARKSKAA